MPPEVGTTDNSAVTTTQTSAGTITSGTASDAMIKAAQAASSAEDSTGSQAATGDTPKPGATGTTPPQAGAKPPAATAGQPNATGTDGPVPLDRHQAAVRNARTGGIHAVAEALGMDRDSFGTQGIKDLRVAVQTARELQSNPTDFLRRLAHELKMRLVPMSGQPSEEDLADEPFPEADLETPDKSRRAFSDVAFKKALQIQRAQIIRELRGEMEPLRRSSQSREEQEQETSRQDGIRQTHAVALAEARKLPHFKENEDAIAEKLGAMDPTLKRQMGAVAAMHLAFGQVMAEKVLPTYDKKAEEKVRADLKKKAGAGGVHPTGDTTGDQKPVLKQGDVEGLAAHMRWLEQQGASA